ncbi:MAG: hypothetical protein Q8Q86_03435 [Candidatus Daviesbacteria bacterium]|nr:hypothetical protein [Candidatus Daviesbacteria bacterium]
MSPSKTQDERKLAILKAQAAKDKLFKLVVKIISWESDSLDSVVVKSLNKITEAEWLNYRKYTLNISTSQSLEKVKEKLTQTYKNIRSHGGFTK